MSGEPVYRRWLADHGLATYAGQLVAIHPTEGIVASGESFDEVVAEVKRKGVDHREVMIVCVPKRD